MVVPVLVGGGKRLFPDDSRRVALELAGTQAFETGVVVQTYRPPRG